MQKSNGGSLPEQGLDHCANGLLWYVLKTKPHREKEVLAQLGERGVETYYPMLKAFRKYLGRGQRQVEPLFPGYVFARMDLAWREEMRRLPGLQGVVRFGAQFPHLSDEVIAELRGRQTPEGYIRLRPPARRFHAAEPVCVADGLFAGREGRFSHYLNGPERVCILLRFLSRLVPVELPAACLRPPYAPPAPKFPSAITDRV